VIRRPRLARLSSKTRKQTSKLSPHEKHIFTKAHANALKEYKNPSKRRGGKSQSIEEVVHKVAWSAVKKSKK